MKKYIIILSAMIGFSGSNLTAQDVSLTNAKLVKPSGNNEYGSACFTLIAEDGLDVTSIPLAVEVSLSKVDFDADGISGFNSELFMWEVDDFVPNVVKGTLVANIPSVDDGGGGAQICIPVKRDTPVEFDEARNGFLVNVVPGSVDQGGNSGADVASRFGFSNSQNSSIHSNNGSDARTSKESDKFKFQMVSIYPNPAKDVITFTTTAKGIGAIDIFNANGYRVKSINGVSNGSRIAIEDFAPGIYHLVFTGEAEQKSISKRLIVVR